MGGSYCLRCGAFKVAHNYEHLVIHVLIELLRELLTGTIAFLVLDRYQSVILYEEFAYNVLEVTGGTILLMDDNQWLRLGPILGGRGLS